MAKATRRLFLSGALGLAGAGAAGSVAAQSSSEIVVSTAEEFVQAIGPDRTIKLKPGTYTLSDLNPYIRTPHAYFTETGTTGYELVVSGADNLRIVGEGKQPRILTQPRSANVLRFINCQNIAIDNIEAGHSPEPGYCSGGVLHLKSCRNVSINNSVLFGSGTVGIQASKVDNLTCKNTVIKECSDSILRIWQSHKFSFQDCQFLKNGQFDLVQVYGSSNVSFQACQFKENFTEPVAIKLSDGTIFVDSSEEYYLFKIQSSAPAQLSDCTIADNRVNYFTPEPSQLKLVNTRFSNNRFALSNTGEK